MCRIEEAEWMNEWMNEAQKNDCPLISTSCVMNQMTRAPAYTDTAIALNMQQFLLKFVHNYDDLYI